MAQCLFWFLLAVGLWSVVNNVVTTENVRLHRSINNIVNQQKGNKDQLSDVQTELLIMDKMLRDPRVEGPVIVVVDIASTPLELAQRLLASVLSTRNKFEMSFLLITFDAVGVGKVQGPLGVNAFMVTLNSLFPGQDIQDVRQSTLQLALSVANQNLTANSVVLLFTEQTSVYESLAEIAAKYVEKSSKLFVWWCGPRDQDFVLREAAEITGGKLFLSTLSTYQELAWSALIQQSDSMETIAVRYNASGKQTVPFLIDSTISSVRVTIVGEVPVATLISPGGQILGIESEESLRKYTDGAVSLSQDPQVIDVQLIITSFHFGMWNLKTASSTEYDVTVRAVSTVGVADVHFNQTIKTDDTNTKISLYGEIDRIVNVRILDDLSKNIQWIEYIITNENDGRPGVQLDLSLHYPNQKSFYLQIVGETHDNQQFERLAFVARRDTGNGKLILLQVEPISKLISSPGKFHDILFDITNNSSEPLRLVLSSQSKWMNIRYSQFYMSIGPGQTNTVQLVLQIPINKPVRNTDIIVVTAEAEGEVETLTLFVYVERVVRKGLPNVVPRIDRDCRGAKHPGNCSSKSWVMHTTVQSPSGIFEITSEPKGVEFIAPFIIGTRSRISTKYTASCCHNEVQLTVKDLYNHTVVTKVDVYAINLVTR